MVLVPSIPIPHFVVLDQRSWVGKTWRQTTRSRDFDVDIFFFAKPSSWLNWKIQFRFWGIFLAFSDVISTKFTKNTIQVGKSPKLRRIGRCWPDIFWLMQLMTTLGCILFQSHVQTRGGFKCPKQSMYDIFAYIYHRNKPNGGKYASHGEYG